MVYGVTMNYFYWSLLAL